MPRMMPWIDLKPARREKHQHLGCWRLDLGTTGLHRCRILYKRLCNGFVVQERCIWRLCTHKMLYLEGNIFSVVCKSYWHTKDWHPYKQSVCVRTCAVKTSELHWDQGRTLFDIKASVATTVVRQEMHMPHLLFLYHRPPIDRTAIFDSSSCAVQK